MSSATARLEDQDHILNQIRQFFWLKKKENNPQWDLEELTEHMRKDLELCSISIEDFHYLFTMNYRPEFKLNWIKYYINIPADKWDWFSLITWGAKHARGEASSKKKDLNLSQT